MKHKYAHTFADEAPSEPAPPPPKPANGPEYHFDGYSVVINEKIALTPVKWHKKKKDG